VIRAAAVLVLVLAGAVQAQEVPIFTPTEADEIRDIVDEAILDIRYDAPLWSTSDHPELRVEIIAPISRTISLGLGYRGGSYDKVLALGQRIIGTKKSYGMVTLRARVRLGEL